MSLNNDDIKLLISILQKALVTDEQESDTSVEQPKAANAKKQASKPIAKTKKKKVANSSSDHYNKFESMPERNMHKEDSQIDKMLTKYAPTERSREFSLATVTCRVCGRTETINPNLIYDAGSRYKCNKCAKNPG